MKRFLAIFLMMFLLAGCMDLIQNDPTPTETPSPAPTEQQTEEAQDPAPGGELRIPMRTPKTLNPLLNEDETVDSVLKLLFEPLMVLDENLKPQPNLANFNFAPDGMSVSITLRDGLVWSDGEPIVSEDISFSVDMLRSAPDTVIYKSVISNMTGVYTITDEKTIRIHFLQPFSGSRYQFCFPIIPKHHYEGQDSPASDANMNPVGSGLYMFSSYPSMKELKLTVNPGTYRQKPYITDIEVLIVPDQESEMHSYDQSILDVVSAEIADWGRYRNNQTTNINEYTTSYFDFIGFNFNNEKLKDKRIRQAVAMLVDRDDVIGNIYLTHADKANSPVNPSSWLYEPNTPSYSFDMDKAGALFSEAKFSGTLRIAVNKENVERVKIGQLLAKNLEELNISVKLEELEFAEYMRRIGDKDFDLFIGGFNLTLIPDLSFAFGSGEDRSNVFSYQDDVMNGLLSSAFSSTTEIAYKKAMSDLQKHIGEELPCVSLVFRRSAMLTDQRVQGPKTPNMSNIFANINQWHIAS
jgi:peptide/nickel transport system substrate-binding protein